MKKQSLILVGGGGHCRSCIDVIEQQGEFIIRGILDQKEEAGKKVFNYKILGDDELINDLVAKGYLFLITVGQLKSASTRLKLFQKLKKAGAMLATVISPKAHVSSYAKVGEGTIILHGAIVNAGVIIGNNSIINSLSLIEHDANVGNHVHISTGSLVNGSCIIGDESFIGSGSIIGNNISIANNVVVGAGSLVLKSINCAGTYFGSPMRKIH